MPIFTHIPGTSFADVTLSGVDAINYVMDGVKWDLPALPYAFPLLASDFGTVSTYGPEVRHFQPATAQMQTAAIAALASIASFTSQTFVLATDPATANLRWARTDAITAPTAYGYLPNSGLPSGDAWFGQNGAYNNPQMGDYAWSGGILHETGHLLGLKHPQDAGRGTNTSIAPANLDSTEFSVMSYRSFPGADTTTGYSNEAGGYAQTYMMYDIAALQYMYGANFSGPANQVYSFNALTGEMAINGLGQGAPVANRIFRTIWDGGGNATYDFSAYSTSETIDLTPGGWSMLSAVQDANLGNGHMARGEVFNALQYNHDVRSLIANAKGGSGNDTITGNAADNIINPGNGNNVVYGGGGTDTIDYSTSGNGVYVDLDAAFSVHDFTHADGIYGIEAIIGNNQAYKAFAPYSDILYGLSAGGTTFYGLGGADFITGRGTNNTASYARDAANAGVDGVFADLGAGYAKDGFGTIDSLVDIQNVEGTNRDYSIDTGFSDILYGAYAGGTTFYGLGGADYMYGRGLGNTSDYSHDLANGGPQGIIAYLPSNFVRDGHNCYDYVSGIQNITGTYSADTIIGDGNANILKGGAGNDYIDGGAGNDTLEGGLGSDVLFGGTGNVTVLTTDADMALGNGDYFAGFHAGDILEFSADMAGKLLILAGASNDVVIYAQQATGYWYMDIASTTLAAVNAPGAIVYG